MITSARKQKRATTCVDGSYGLESAILNRLPFILVEGHVAEHQCVVSEGYVSYGVYNLNEYRVDNDQRPVRTFDLYNYDSDIKILVQAPV